ncbi:MAG: crossover junction endodeoxyribonuclease RuvC [Bacteroidales bacterium]
MKRSKPIVAQKPEKDLIVLTNDPSLTAWGYAVIHKGKIVKGGCIETEPKAKVNRIRKGDDRVRRIHELNIELLNIIRSCNVNYIVSELPHGSQNAAAAAMVGMAADKVQTIGDCLNIPVEWYSEDDAKKHLFGKQKITKQDMVDKIDKLYKVTWLGSKKRNSGLADAIAVYHVAKDYSQVINFYKNF